MAKHNHDKPGELIGRGKFSRAYYDGEKVTLHSVCPIKECISWGWFPDSDLFPDIERVDIADDYQVYEMKYYPKVRSLKNNLTSDQYEIYKTLRWVFTEGISQHFNVKPRNLFYHWHSEFDKIKDDNLRETMKEALDACGNYGTDICFEISPRNVAVDNGKLVLLDVFFVNSCDSFKY